MIISKIAKLEYVLKKYAKEENNISLKEINKKNILKIVIEMGPISRIGISK